MPIAGKYRLLRELTEGGFGLIYEAIHTKLTRDPKRAVKVIKPEFVDSEELQTRFAREVQVTSALSQMNNHIVRIYDDFGEIPNFGHFFVMEFLEGQPLNALQEEHKYLLPLELCYHLFAQLCDAIHAAHSEGVVHRDLKPENLFIISRLREPHFLKVIDFGIARPTESDSRMTQLTQGALGTPEYMSPEQCLNKGIGPGTDIYAMGIILFELLAGHTPFLRRVDGVKEQKAMMEILTAHMMMAPPNLMQVMPPGRDIPSALADVVAKALAKVPEDRFATVEEFETAFKQAISQPLSSSTMGMASPVHSAPVIAHGSQPLPTAEGPYTDMGESTVVSAGISQPPQALASEFGLPSGEIASAYQHQQGVPNETTPEAVPAQAPYTPDTLQNIGSFKPRSKAPLLATVGVVLLLLAGGGFWFLQQQSKTPSVGNPPPTAAPKPGTVGRTPAQRRKKIRSQRVPPRVRRAQPQKRRVVAPAPRRRLRRNVVRYVPPARRKRTPQSRRSRRRIQRSRWYRPSQGCPRRPSRYWVYLKVATSQRNQIVVRHYRGPRATIVSRPNGDFCVGVRSTSTKVRLQGVRDGFFPCTFKVWKKPKRIRVTLTASDDIAPDQQDACIRR